jgi:hypothetical protein
MPSGPLETVPILIESILSVEPQRILDIGVGTGKWGFLLREQRDLAKGRHELRIDGIEGYAPYIGDHQRAVYDRIYIADVRTWLPSQPDQLYDVALMLDVIEHFSPDEAKTVVQEALRVSRTLVLSTPKRFYPQSAPENDLERHLSWWPRGALRKLALACGACISLAQLRDTNIALVSRQAQPPVLRVHRVTDLLANAKDLIIPERFYYKVLGKTGPTL